MKNKNLMPNQIITKQIWIVLLNIINTENMSIARNNDKHSLHL